MTKGTILGLLAVLTLGGCASAATPPPQPTPQIIYVTPSPAPTSSPSPTPSIAATDTPPTIDTPAPTATAPLWHLTATSFTYDSQTYVGGTIEVTVTIKNSGTRANPATELDFPNLHVYADLQGCKPTCDIRGSVTALLPGIQPHKTLTVTVTWIATKVGVARWSFGIHPDPSDLATFLSAEDLVTTIQ